MINERLIGREREWKWKTNRGQCLLERNEWDIGEPRVNQYKRATITTEKKSFIIIYSLFGIY